MPEQSWGEAPSYHTFSRPSTPVVWLQPQPQRCCHSRQMHHFCSSPPISHEEPLVAAAPSVTVSPSSLLCPGVSAHASGSQMLYWAQGSVRGQRSVTGAPRGHRAMPTLPGTHSSLRCPGRGRQFCLGTGTAHRGSWGGHPHPLSVLFTLWGPIVLPRPCGDTLGLPVPPSPMLRAPCLLALCCLGCPHSPAPLHIWDGNIDGSPCTPQEGSDTCTLLWAGVTEPPVIYFYTLYYNSCFYSFVLFVLCLVELHVPALPTAMQRPPGAA